MYIFVVQKVTNTMARKRSTVVVTGMNRDTSKSKFDGKFSFENKNIRITPRDGSCTSFAVTNEKGTELLDAVVYGTPVGTFTCDKYFGVFSYDKTYDYITVYKYDNGSVSEFFQWKGKGLGFSEVNPSERRMETVVSVEAENSIRVYWVDGIHELRVIDFMRLKEKIGDKVVDTVSSDTREGVDNILVFAVQDVTMTKIGKMFYDVINDTTADSQTRAMYKAIFTEWVNETTTDMLELWHAVWYRAVNGGYFTGLVAESGLDDLSAKLYKAFKNVLVYYTSGINNIQNVGSYSGASSFKQGQATTLKYQSASFLDAAIKTKAAFLKEEVLNKVVNADYFSYLPVIYPDANAKVTAGSNGAFRTGTVQFCVTEVINGNESNIVWTSPLYYCHDLSNGRAYSTDNTTTGNNFKVSFDIEPSAKTGMRVDFINVYAIHRSSQDGTPSVYKQETTFSKSDTSISVSVNMIGTEEAVDASYLFSLNRRLMNKVTSICDKDGLLFLGGYAYATQAEVKSVVASVNIERSAQKKVTKDTFNGKRNTHSSQLSSDSFTIGHFKKNEYYALGIQVQDSRGYWSDPVPVLNSEDGDCLNVMTMTAKGQKNSNDIYLPYFYSNIKLSDFGDDVIAVRPVVAYMDDSQKQCLYQGMVTPTIFCEKERVEGQVYAKLSPFTRTMKAWGKIATGYNPRWETVNPAYVVTEGDENRIKPFSANVFLSDMIISAASSALGYQMTAIDYVGATPNLSARGGTFPASQHLAALGTTKDYNCELQTSWYYRDIAFKSAMIPHCTTNNGLGENSDDGSEAEVVEDYNTSDVFTHDNAGYYVDARTVSFHSPDIKDETVISSSSISIAGSIPMKGFASDTSIVATTPTLEQEDEYGGESGFQHIQLGSSTAEGRCAMNLPNWVGCYRNNTSYNLAQYWSVPPFGVDDYIGAELDQSTEGSERTTGKLTYKQLVNYRYSECSEYFDTSKSVYDCYIKIADGSNENCVVYGSDNKIYKPAEDVVITPSTTSMWTNGPYYSRTEGMYYTLGGQKFNTDFSTDKYGVMSINKFNCYDLGWMWAMYATIFLRRKDNMGPLYFNYVSLLSFVHNTTQYPGYWRQGGTKSGASLEYDGTNIVGVSLGKGAACQYDNAFNAYNKTHIFLGNNETGGERFNSKHKPKSYTVRMKYCSTPHAVISLQRPEPFPNYGGLVKYALNNASNYKYDLYMNSGWNGGDKLVKVGDSAGDYNASSWSYMDMPDETDLRDSLWLVDVINNTEKPKFDKSTARWIVAGEAVSVASKDEEVYVEWKQGDWYYQRWDCLRTYPKSVEDKNQVVEIVSFMCETRRNLDGRYDSHAGQPFLQANPENYNLINDAYTQQNNFFSFTMPSDNDNVVNSFPTYIAWSLPKALNSNVDNWTALGALSNLDMAGDAGDITSLVRFGNNIYCFQPSAISIISYNGRTQVTAEDGMPVELAASKSVEGKYVLTENRGATSNLAIAVTDSAVYFADEYNKTLCAFSQNVQPISDALGFHSWAHALPDFKFNVFTDPRTSSVLFDRINGGGVTLSFKEPYNQFESFYDNGGSPLTLVVTGDTLCLHDDGDGAYGLWRFGTGKPNVFFGDYKPFWIDYIFSDGASTDKVYDNIEFSGDVLVDGQLSPKRCPYNYVRAYSEYQDSGWKKLDFVRYMPSNAKNLYRIWRAFVPRDASKTKAGKVAERMRNPWMHIVLKYEPADDEEARRCDPVEIQETNVYYNEM